MQESQQMAPTSQREPLGRRLLTVTEAAEMLNISRSNAYRLVASGELKSVTIGSLKRIPLAEIDDWIECLLEEGAA